MAACRAPSAWTVTMRSAIIVVKIPDNIFCSVPPSSGLSFKVLRCVPRGPSGGYSLVKIGAPPAMDEAALVALLKDSEPGRDVDIASREKDGYLVTVSNARCTVCGSVAESGCFLESARPHGDGRMTWGIAAPDAAAIRGLVARLRERGCEVELVSVRERGRETRLTDRQEEAVRVACDLGYYDIPRRTDLDELAGKLGIGKSALDVILRRAEGKLVRCHLAKE
ncbi:helix-turn-helix domain-containing protein [Methanomassiliicoccus luminyensis]|uniref:helix-turn-helix domain-containing protein n=1 Tax=Methanomassiliicoccus luminyensis TaxID=1080712 RepID=UPI00138AF733|nr:helix-turn-helix domain-containing protein [Methanomassiliicoccus luminyensis]